MKLGLHSCFICAATDDNGAKHLFLIFVFSMNKEKPGWRMMERIIIDYILCHHCEE